MSLDVSFKYEEFLKLERRLILAGKDTDKRMKRANTAIAATVKDLSSDYAPKSPTDAEAKARGGKSGKTLPGALQSSIDMKATVNFAEIFVPTNSPAGAYAYRIHEEKGSKWWKRGPGTVAKGEKADEKFIERAISDSEKDLITILDDEIKQIKKELSK